MTLDLTRIFMLEIQLGSVICDLYAYLHDCVLVGGVVVVVDVVVVSVVDVVVVSVVVDVVVDVVVVSVVVDVVVV